MRHRLLNSIPRAVWQRQPALAVFTAFQSQSAQQLCTAQQREQSTFLLRNTSQGNFAWPSSQSASNPGNPYGLQPPLQQRFLASSAVTMAKKKQQNKLRGDSVNLKAAYAGVKAAGLLPTPPPPGNATVARNPPRAKRGQRAHRRHGDQSGLQKLISEGNSREAWGAFYSLMNVPKGVTVKDCTIMLKACYSSEDTRDMIDITMPKAGVTPNVVTYNTFVSMLMMEGDVDGARRVVKTEMPAASINLDNRTKELLGLPDRDLGRMRTKC